MKNPFRYFNSSPEIIRNVVMLYVRYPLSLRQVEDLLFERGIDICHETVRYWWNRFGPLFAAEIRKRRIVRRNWSNWRWHFDEVFVRINGETHYLWRAVDHEGGIVRLKPYFRIFPLLSQLQSPVLIRSKPDKTCLCALKSSKGDGERRPSRFNLMVWTPPFRRRVRQNGVWFELQTEGASTMDITTIGFDLAKTVFQVHGADGEGRAVLRRKLRRGKVLAFFAGLPSCLVGMEACASAHYWAREIQALGHEVRLIPPQYVRPFVKTNKNDAADAEAICEAVTRPTMRFAPAKSAEQQSVLMLHRARELLVRQRTMVINALRGHCAELGLIVAQGASKVEELVAIIEDPGDVRLPPLAREALGSLVEQLHSAQARIKQLEATLLAWHRSNQASRRLATIPGVGVITATALVATIGDGAQFRSGRQLSAWLGLVPRQHSSGGKDRLGRISKRGDGYIRRLLVHGARSVLRWRRAKPGTGPGWTDRLLARRPTNVVLVAMANKTARVAWALLRYERIYRPTPA